MDSQEALLRTGVPNSWARFGAHSNHPEADGQTERTSRTLIQYLRLYKNESSFAWRDFLFCAEWFYNITVHSSTRCSPASLVYTETPLSDPVLDLAVGSQPCSGAGEECREHIRLACECMRKAQELQARNYDKRRSAVTFELGDLVRVDAHAQRGAQDGEHARKFATRWVRPFAVPAPVNALAYTLELPPEWRCQKTITIGFLKRVRESATFPRTLPRRATTCGPAYRAGDARKPGLQRVEGGLGKNS